MQISVLSCKLYNFDVLRPTYFITIAALFFSISLTAQDSLSLHKQSINRAGRKWLIGGISAASYTGSLIMLNETWYKDYPKSSFHTFNDAKEWQQVDKVGHAWSAYNLSRGLTSAWRWAGMKDKDAILLGSASGFSYLMIIEMLDAQSVKWGWSWADVGANTFGSALFALQEGIWKEQKVLLKFSSHVIDYKELNKRADELFGSSKPERILKDYNAQTYWLSVNAKSLFPQTNLPGWLNLSFGYGAKGMFGGFENTAYDTNGNITFHRPDINRQRQWYVAPDVDFSRIKTNSKALKTTFTILNMLKFPAPALELSKGKLKVHAFYF